MTYEIDDETLKRLNEDRDYDALIVDAQGRYYHPWTNSDDRDALGLLWIFGEEQPWGKLLRRPGVETSPGLERPRDPKEKDTNPKAAIGVRKVPFSVIPMDVIAEVGLAMLEGSAKYGRHNYRAAGARASVYFDGTMRHLTQWWEGEDTDPDAKGVSHITKAIASLTVLRAAMLAGKFEDDRPPRTDINWVMLNAQAAAIIDMHADKTPKHYTEKDSNAE